jgi:hypothetical protein
MKRFTLQAAALRLRALKQDYFAHSFEGVKLEITHCRPRGNGPKVVPRRADGGTLNSASRGYPRSQKLL